MSTRSTPRKRRSRIDIPPHSEAQNVIISSRDGVLLMRPPVPMPTIRVLAKRGKIIAKVKKG